MTSAQFNILHFIKLKELIELDSKDSNQADQNYFGGSFIKSQEDIRVTYDSFEAGNLSQ